MIQDIAPHQYINQYDPAKKPGDGSMVLAVQNGKIWIREGENGEISFPRYGQVKGIKGTCTFAFTLDGEDYFLLETEEPPRPGYTAAPRVYFREARPKHLAFAAVTGLHLAGWYKNSQYCGRCGTKTEHSEIERMMRCPKCGNMIYPRISPAVIVGVRNGEKLLVTKYAGKTSGDYALVAGFNEIGETIEETVRREVLEETGVRVKNITFYKSQPWSFTDTLLMGFYCDLDGSDAIHMDDGELGVAEWVERTAIPTEEKDLSLTNEMICRFKKGLA